MIATLEKLFPQKDNLINCSMNEAIILNHNIPKSIIITHGVASCIVVIIYHSKKDFTIFGHLNETSDFAETQKNFLNILIENKIPISEVEVILAGGWVSYNLSVNMCQWIKKFWTEQNVQHINVDLLFSRDGLVLPANQFGEYYNHRLKHYPPDQLMDYIRNTVNKRGGDLYNIFKNSHPIDNEVKKIIIDYCIEKLLINPSDKNSLISATRLTHNNGQHIVSVFFNNPMKCLFHLIGFDRTSNKLIFSYENCWSLTDSKISLENTTDFVTITNLVVSPEACIPLLKGMGSPIHQANDHHHKLMAEVHAIVKQNNFFDPLLKCLNEKSYEKALRLLCNNINKSELNLNLIQILLHYQDSLKIDINQQAGEKHYAPIHYAALHAHSGLYHLLTNYGADPSLKSKEEKTAPDLFPSTYGETLSQQTL
jgi:hypothetical protein